MFDALADWLPGCGADVLCLQEVTRTPGLGGWTSFEDAERHLPQRANLFDDVRRALPAHQAIFVASDAGPVTDDSGVTHRQDFGLALFVHERFPIVGLHTDFVHGRFVDHDTWAIEDRPRVAQAVRLTDRDAGRFVTVTHLHGLRDPAGKHDTPGTASTGGATRRPGRSGPERRRPRRDRRRPEPAARQRDVRRARHHRPRRSGR